MLRVVALTGIIYRVSTQRGVCRSVRHKIETDKMIHTQNRANIIQLPHTHPFFLFFNRVGDLGFSLGSRWSTLDSLKEKIKHFHLQTNFYFRFAFLFVKSRVIFERQRHSEWFTREDSYYARYPHNGFIDIYRCTSVPLIISLSVSPINWWTRVFNVLFDLSTC